MSRTFLSIPLPTERRSIPPHAPLSIHYSMSSGVPSRSSAVLNVVTEYLLYKHVSTNADARDDVPNFDERVPPELSLEV